MPYRRMLVPLDGSQGSWKAFRKALVLAKEMDAEVNVVSVEEHLPHFPATVDEVDEEQEFENRYFTKVHSEAIAFAREQGMEIKTEVVLGHAAKQIVHYASEGSYDLIVIGHIGHSGLWGALLGSTTDRVVGHSPCDVLVVR